MKAIQIEAYGGPEVMLFKDVQEPVPGAGEILVAVEAAGVNYIDTYHRRGLYPLPLPFSPGTEGVGKVVAVGTSVTRFQPGDRVVFCLGIGAYAERAVVAEAKAVHLPEGVGTDEGLACMVQGMTAHYLTTDCFHLQEGQSALVHAAAGGVGMLLVQMAKRIGAQVFATVSTEAKAELARELGADHVILYSKEDFLQEIRRLTSGKGVDVVYESVGRETFLRSMECLKPRGYLVLYGQSSGPVPPFDPQLLNQKGSLFLTRPSLGHYVATAAEFTRRAEETLNMVAERKLKVQVGTRLPLERAAEAHRLLEGRATVGKIVLEV